MAIIRSGFANGYLLQRNCQLNYSYGLEKTNTKNYPL